MALPGEIQSLVDILASVGKDTAGGLLGVADYARGKITGEDVSASEALERGRELTGDDWYTPGPEGEAVNQELLQAVSGVIGAMGMGIPGSGPLAREAADQLSKLDDNVKAGLELAASALDITPAGLLATLPASLLKMTGSADEIMQAIILFHGGPHRWTRPEPLGNHMGTGTQKFGAGLYTADDPKVAEDYIKFTSHRNKVNEATINGRPMEEFLETLDPYEEQVFRAAWDDFADGINRGVDDYGSGEDISEHFLDYIANPQYGFENAIEHLDLDWSPETVEGLRKKMKRFDLGPDRGYLYEMEVPDERLPDMLDVDKPIGLQEDWISQYGPGLETLAEEGDLGAEAILEMIREGATDGETGMDVYHNLTLALGSPNRASEYLRDMGVPGLKQWDPHYKSDPMLWKMRDLREAGKSDDEIIETLMREYGGARPLGMEDDLRRRLSAPEMARNYVLFDENAIKDIKRTEFGDSVQEVDPRTMPRPDAKFPQYADEMPEVPDPVYSYENTVKKPEEILYADVDSPIGDADLDQWIEEVGTLNKVGEGEGAPFSKAWLSKGSTPETEAFLAERRAIQERIDRGEYTPYYDVEARTDVPSDVFDTQGDTLVDTLAKTEDTRLKHRADIDKKYGFDKMEAEMLDAYQHGMSEGGHDRWYYMGQLFDDYVKDFGPEKGPEMFRDNFSKMMAATTGGSDPTENLVTAGFVNFMKNKGLDLPEYAWQMPSPVGGRFVSGNVKMGGEVKDGRVLGMDEPKRHNFQANYEGHAGPSTIDEQMTSGMTDGDLQAPPNLQYGLFEGVVNSLANKLGKQGRDVQDVIWGGLKDKSNKAAAQEKLDKAQATMDNPKQQKLLEDKIAKRQALLDSAKEKLAKARTEKQREAAQRSIEFQEEMLAKVSTPASKRLETAKEARAKAGHKGKPMIQIYNEAIERTSALTGRSPEEVARLMRAGQIPVYGVAGAVGLGALTNSIANQTGGMEDMY